MNCWTDNWILLMTRCWPHQLHHFKQRSPTWNQLKAPTAMVSHRSSFLTVVISMPPRCCAGVQQNCMYLPLVVWSTDFVFGMVHVHTADWQSWASSCFKSYFICIFLLPRSRSGFQSTITGLPRRSAEQSLQPGRSEANTDAHIPWDNSPLPAGHTAQKEDILSAKPGNKTARTPRGHRQNLWISPQFLGCNYQ